MKPHISSSLQKFQLPVAMNDAELKSKAAKLWHDTGTVMIKPEWLHDGSDRQSLLDLARMMYGRRKEQ